MKKKIYWISENPLSEEQEKAEVAALRPGGCVLASRAHALGRHRIIGLSDFVNEKAALLPEMALRIEKAFGGSMDTAPIGVETGRRFTILDEVRSYAQVEY